MYVCITAALSGARGLLASCVRYHLSQIKKMNRSGTSSFIIQPAAPAIRPPPRGARDDNAMEPRMSTGGPPRKVAVLLQRSSMVCNHNETQPSAPICPPPPPPPPPPCNDETMRRCDGAGLYCLFVLRRTELPRKVLHALGGRIIITGPLQWMVDAFPCFVPCEFLCEFPSCRHLIIHSMLCHNRARIVIFILPMLPQIYIDFTPCSCSVEPELKSFKVIMTMTR